MQRSAVRLRARGAHAVNNETSGGKRGLHARARLGQAAVGARRAGGGGEEDRAEEDLDVARLKGLPRVAREELAARLGGAVDVGHGHGRTAQEDLQRPRPVARRHSGHGVEDGRARQQGHRDDARAAARE